MSQWVKISEWIGRRTGGVPELSIGDTAKMLELAKELKADVELLIADLDAHQRKLVGVGAKLISETSDGELVHVKTGSPKPKYVYEADDDVLALVVARAVDQRRVDPETGEMLDREADVVAQAIGRVWNLSADKARVGKAGDGSGLAGLGIDVKDIRHRSN